MKTQFLFRFFIAFVGLILHLPTMSAMRETGSKKANQFDTLVFTRTSF